MLISRQLLRFLVVNETKYVTQSGCYFRPVFFHNLVPLVRKLYNQVPMLFISATMTQVSMHFTEKLLHPNSPFTNCKQLPPHFGLDNPSMQTPIYNPHTFFNAYVWGPAARKGIDVDLEFTTKYKDAICPFVITYVQVGCKVLGYCINSNDAKTSVKKDIQVML